MSRQVLILGGTTEAVQLAHALAQHRTNLDITISLAGATQAPSDMPGHVLSGSFGGAEGLSEFLHTRGIKAVIDATHPFAEQISRNAQRACAAVGVPCLHLERAPWTLPADTDVVFVPDAQEAALLVARTSTAALLTIGRKQLHVFEGLANVRLVVRLLEPTPSQPHLLNATYVYGRPPFAQEDEEALMRAHKIDTLVSKASGGEATRSKIDAAAHLGVRIVLIRRPVPVDGERVQTTDDALKWLNTQLP